MKHCNTVNVILITTVGVTLAWDDDQLIKAHKAIFPSAPERFER